MAGFNPYAAKGVPTPKAQDPLAAVGGYIGRGLSDFLGSQAVADSPYAALGSLFAPRKAYAQGERQGPYVPERIKNAPTAPLLPGAGTVAPITSPNTRFEAADEEYNRLKSQYGGPAGVEQLAMQTTLPTGFTPTGAKGPASLKDFYSAESQVGRRDIESIIPSLTKGLQGKDAQNMAAWATANPMLAQREYAKKMGAEQAAAGYGGTGPSDEAIRAAMASGKFFPAAGSPSPVASAPGFAGQTSFSGAANAVPAPPQQQGAAVSAPYAAANAQAAEKTAGATGMPAFETTAQPQTTLDKVSGFLNSLTPVIKTVFPAGAGQIFGPRY